MRYLIYILILMIVSNPVHAEELHKAYDSLEAVDDPAIEKLAYLVNHHPRKEIREGFPRNLREKKFLLEIVTTPTDHENMEAGFAVVHLVNILDNKNYGDRTIVMSIQSDVLLGGTVSEQESMIILWHEYIHLLQRWREQDSGLPASIDEIDGIATEIGAKKRFLSELEAYHGQVILTNEMGWKINHSANRAFREGGFHRLKSWLGFELAVRQKYSSHGELLLKLVAETPPPQ